MSLVRSGGVSLVKSWLLPPLGMLTGVRPTLTLHPARGEGDRARGP